MYHSYRYNHLAHHSPFVPLRTFDLCQKHDPDQSTNLSSRFAMAAPRHKKHHPNCFMRLAMLLSGKRMCLIALQGGFEERE